MNPYQLNKEETYKQYKTSHQGISDTEAKRRLKANGANILIEKKPKSKLKIFINQFTNLLVFLLLIVGILSLVHALITKSDLFEPIVIICATLINCIMGYLQESKAEDAVAKLKKYETSRTLVKRNDEIYKIESSDLVCGDYIILEAGDKIPADARVIESYFGKCNESVLTGESLNVEKTEEPIAKEVGVSERTNMIYAGTILVSGKIEAVVTATGMNTELGKIASVLNDDKEVITPLQIKVQKVTNFISVVAVFLVLLVLCYGLINDYTLLNVIMLCISMIVASIPECLPVAITATLSIGVNMMSKKKSIVRNMAAIETLGATDIICTDKTGTITTNKMEVIKIYTNNEYINDKDLKKHLEFASIINNCNNASLKNKKYSGDSVDVALKEVLKVKPYKQKERLLELPFDSKRKLMSVITEDNIIYTKGSLENILDKCNYILINGKKEKLLKNQKIELLKVQHDMAANALKVIGFAYKENVKIKKSEDEYYKEENNLIFVGIIGLKDPARSNVKKAIETCCNAGIRPIMITGDNLETANSIALEVGIIKSSEEGINADELTKLSKEQMKKIVNKYNVFARVSPENKVQIVEALQSLGKVVAMTGDGINDAPAIKLAHVGIGMGKSGTDVTKSVADIILLDDSYKTITTAISEGRRIYDNVISNILYNLSSNFTEIIILLIGMFTGNTIISALHVLYIDLIADSIPSVALACEGPSKDIMNRKPNGLNKKVFTPYFIAFLIVSVLIETTISLFVYASFQNQGIKMAQTLALFSIVLNEFVFAYNCRSLKEPIYKRGIFSNKYLNLGIFGLLIIQCIIFFTPIGKIFGLEIMNIYSLIFVFCINLISFILIEFVKPILVKIFKDE